MDGVEDGGESEVDFAVGGVEGDLVLSMEYMRERQGEEKEGVSQEPVGHLWSLSESCSSLCQVDGISPDVGRGVDCFHERFDSIEILLDLRFGDNERRGDLEHHEVVAAHLGEDVVMLEEAFNEHLSKHTWVDGMEGLKRYAQPKRRWRLEDDAIQHAETADFREHLEPAEALGELSAKFGAQPFRS